VSEAIKKAEQASLLAPNSAGLFFQLGVLKYTAKDYAGAASALERATVLSPDYANAMYFLGLSYDNVGKKDEAKKQFARLAELNPDNQEIKDILVNLEAGRSALFNITPTGNAPENQDALPIKES
jgi:tetratricopeptide (TPR) repeat protein